MLVACADTPTWSPPASEARSLGEEIYVVLCDRVAVSEMPSDVRGRRSNDLCHRNAKPVADTPARLRAISENRTRLVSALNATLTTGALDDNLGSFLTELLPFYEAPRERLPEMTRAFAELADRLALDTDALSAFQRISARRGYRPLEHAVGTLSALLKYPELETLLSAFLDGVGPEGKAHAAWNGLLSALTLELATYTPAAAEVAESTLDVTAATFFRPLERAALDTPLWLSRRDLRGLAIPSSLCRDGSCPFRDADGNGQADVDLALGDFISLQTPTPFPVVSLLADSSLRDAAGRALDQATGQPVYQYVDASQTFAAGLVHELGPLFAKRETHAQKRNVLFDLVDGLNVLLGPKAQASTTYGALALPHVTRTTEQAVALDLVSLFAIIGRSPDAANMLDVLGTLLRDHEPAVAGLTRAMLDAKQLADQSSARFAKPNELWDDINEWIELMSRTSRTPGQETMLEGLMRAIADPRAKHFGDVTAMMLRYKDAFALDPKDINALPKGVFITPVDRTRPDTRDNRSIMERSLHLVGDIDAQRGLCNKSLLVISPCQVMDYDDLGRVFGGAMSEEWELKLGLGLNPLLAALDAVRGTFSTTQPSTLGDIMGIKGLDDHPDPPALIRMLFADIALVDLLLDPILVRNAPANAGEQYWLKRVYANTIEAWEVPLNFDDGAQVSFWDTFRPLAEAFNKHDYDPLDPEHVRDEHSYYLYMELASTLGRYFGHPEAGFGDDPKQPFYNLKADGRAYEGLVADMIAAPGLVATPCDASARAAQRCWVTDQTVAQHPSNVGLYLRLHELLRALQSIKLADGRDGIDLIASFVELVINPHRACDPAGDGLVGADQKGACDNANAPYSALTLRRKAGERFVATNLGARYDGRLQAKSAAFSDLIEERSGRPMIAGGAHDEKRKLARLENGQKVPFRPRRYPSALDQLLVTLNDVDAAFLPSTLADPDSALSHFRSARSTLVDQFLATDGKALKNRTAHALLLATLQIARDRLAVHEQAGDRRAWLDSLTPRMEAFVASPLVSALLELFDVMQRDPSLGPELSQVLAYMTYPARGEDSSADTVLALLDLVQVLRDDANMPGTLSGLARLLAPNAKEAVRDGKALALGDGALTRSTDLLRDMVQVDDHAALSGLLENLVTLHSEHAGARETPFETLVDVTAEVNRASPSRDQGKQMRAEDFAAVFRQISGFMRDERRGLERLYDIVQNRKGP